MPLHFAEYRLLTEVYGTMAPRRAGLHIQLYCLEIPQG